jgi:hypothetical protein
MYCYLEKTINRMAKEKVKKSASAAYREKYRLGIACSLAARIHDLGMMASWGPERAGRLLAVRKAMESELVVTVEKMRLGGTANAAFKRGVAAGRGISLARQTAGSAGRYLEARV